jgi:hypothetical protein
MVKLTQLILHFGDEMNVEQKRYGYGQANIFSGSLPGNKSLFSGSLPGNRRNRSSAGSIDKISEPDNKF